MNFFICTTEKQDRASKWCWKTEQKYSVRTFLDGDEVAIVKVFEKAYVNFGGHSIKTPEEWRWCCLKRPDIEKTGVIVVLDNDSKEIVGYIVAGKSGYVWELSYDPQHDGKEVVSLLLDEATTYLEATGASSVNFNSPQKDAIIRRACQARGFVASEPPRMFLSVLNLQRLIFLLANDRANELTKKFDEIMLIKINEAPFWVDSTIYICIDRMGVKVGNEAQKPTVKLQTNYTTFSSLLFGNTSPLSAFVHARLKIRPLSKTLTMLKFLSKLKIKDDWFYPLSDYG